MKQLILSLLILLLIGQNTMANAVDTLYFGAFGKVAIYHPVKIPNAFVLFVSGDGGWNKEVMVMANNIVAQGAMVAGINIVHYFKSIKTLKSPCYYLAGDFEDISLTIQKKYKFAQYLKPILVGYSSGATLAYGVLAQSPANTFKGLISLGFCPDIEIDRPLCKGSGLSYHDLKKGQAYYLEPSLKLTSPFIALNGVDDMVCTYADTKNYIERMPMAEIISLPKVGHGFAVTRNWLPQFITAYDKVLEEPEYVEKLAAKNELVQSQAGSLLNTELPLILTPTAVTEDLPLVFFISGDGGWTSFDQTVCDKLAEKGMPVVGLDAQKYFWHEKQPKTTADDFSVAIRHYMQLWNRTSFVVLGYSFGACVAPFIANNFDDQLKETLKGVYCFSPDLTGDFEIHISDMLHMNTKDKYNVPNALKQIKVLNPVCIFGQEEDEDLRTEFAKSEARIETLPGTHHYNNDFGAVANIILKDFIKAK